MAKEYEGPVIVTVSRADTGEILKVESLQNNYVLICNGNRYVKSLQIWGTTHQINIAIRK